MALNVIEQCLSDLFSAARSGDSQQVLKYVRHVSLHLNVGLEQELLSPYMLALFSSEQSLLIFIKQFYQSESGSGSFEIAVGESLDLVHVCIDQCSKYVHPYLSLVVDLCLHYMNVATAAKIKCKCLSILQLVVTFGEAVDVGLVVKIYEKLKAALQFKESNTVLQGFGDLMGAIASSYPSLISDDRSLVFLIDFSYRNINDVKTSLPAARGLFAGITGFVTGGFKIPENLRQRLYQCIKFFAEPPEKGAIRTAHRAALLLFEKTTDILAEFIAKEWMFWKNALRKWLYLVGEDLKVGTIAIDKYHMEMAKILKNRVDVDIYNSHVTEFQNDLNDSALPVARMRVSIRGVGCFAESASVYYKPEQIYNNFNALIQRVEYVYFIKTELGNKFLECLPDFITTLSTYGEQLSTLESNIFQSLQKVSILLIKVYPKLAVLHSNLVINSFIRNMICIKRWRLLKLDTFLQDVVMQGVKWSCMHKVAKEVEMENNDNELSYKSYLSLWKGLFKKNHYHEYGEEITQILFDEMIKTLFYFICKLNLNIVEQNEDLSDLSEAYKAQEISDYIIFHNIADLYVDLFDCVDQKYFKKWIAIFTKDIINHTNKFPLNSGFYKLLAIDLKLCNKLQYFTEERLNDKDHVRECFEHVKEFMQVLLKRVRQFTDDLQLACMKIILGAPLPLIKSVTEDFTPVFVNALILGRNYYEIADTVVQTLKKWNVELPRERIDPLLKTLVPMLDSFLRSQVLIESKSTANFETRKTKRPLNKRRILVDSEPELYLLRVHILELLSQVNSEVCWEAANSTVNVSLALWNNNPHLKVQLPYAGTKINFYLDKFLPRALELAVCSSNSQESFNACEFLHAAVMVMLGTSVQMGNQLSELDRMFKQLNEALLILACSAELRIRQMFEPLMMQLVHWFASKKKLGSEQTSIFVESLLDGTVEPTATKIRDFSGKCLREFVAWTTRQITGDESYIKAIQVIDVIVLYRMKYYSTHSDPIKRQAAALIFNNIYAVLREMDNLLNRYWLHCTVVFFESLSQLTYNEREVQVEVAVDHLTRMFVERKVLFNQVEGDKMRPIPSQLKGGTLKDVAVYVLKCSSTINPACRKKCFDVFIKLAPLVEGTFETRIDIQFTTDLESVGVMKWLQKLLCFLDGYVFMLSNDFIINVDMDTKQMDYFLTHVQGLTTKSLNLTSHEISEFINCKSAIAVKMFRLFSLFRTNIVQYKFIDEYYKVVVEYLFNCNLLYSQNFDSNVLEDIFKSVDELLLEKHANVYLCNTWNCNIDLKSSSNVHISQRHLLRGCLLIHQNTHIRFFNQLKSSAVEVLNSLVDEIDGTLHVQQLTSTVEEYYNLLLKATIPVNQEELLKHVTSNRFVKNTTTSEVILYSHYLYETFKDVFREVILLNIMKFASQLFLQWPLVEVCNFILQVIADSNDGHKDKVVLLINDWNQISTFFDSNIDKTMLGLELVEKVARRLDNFISDEIADWLTNLLESIRLENGTVRDYNYLDQIFRTFGSASVGEKRNQVREALWSFNTINMAYLNSPHRKVPTTLTIKILFESAIRSNSVEILNYAIYLHAAIENDCDSQVCVELYIKSASTDCQLETLRCVYEEMRKHDDTLQLKICDNLTHMLRVCNHAIFEQFFTGIIVDVITVLKSSDDFTLKIPRYALLAVLYLRMEFGSDKTCSICKEANVGNDPTGREMMKTLTATAIASLKETLPEGKCPKKFRLYKCYIYNTLVSIVSNSQTSVDYYNLLLSASTKVFQWNCFIDTEEVYKFDLLVDNIPKMKEVIVNIRRKFSNMDCEYNQSQTMFSKHMDEDITRYDFTNTVVRSQVDSNDPQSQNTVLSEIKIKFLGENINNHVCMAPLCGMFKHMAEMDILPNNARWVRDMRNELLTDSNHKNVKLFLAQALINSSECIKCYAQHFIGPIMNIVADGCAGSDGISSFAIDVVTMLTTVWADVDADEEAASRLLKFLMANVYHNIREIYRYNINLIRLAVEKWKNVQIPYEFILSEFDAHADKSKRAEVPIELCAILLRNKISPWQKTIKTFAQKLTTCLKSSHRSVYSLCATVIGLALNFTSTDVQFQSSLQNFEKLIIAKLNEIKCPNKLAICLQNIAKHYPNVVGHFIQPSLALVDCVPQNYKTMYLKIYLERPDVFQEFGVREEAIPLFLSLLKSAEVDLQMGVLEMINSLISDLTVGEIATIGNLEDILKHPNAACRSICYDINIAIYNKLVASKENTFVNKAREILLRGLTEMEPEIEQKILHFWANHEQMPTRITTRFLFLLENFYENYVEDIYLSLSNYILLHQIKQEEDFEDKIFAYPLEECRFENYELSTFWKAQYSSMIPMFTSTMESSNIRATQEYVVKPTQVGTIASQRATFRLSSSQKPDLDFKDPNDYNITEEYKVAYRRFHKDRSEVSKFHAGRETLKKNRIETNRKEAAKKKASEVTILRKYRRGDFPDIQIGVCDVILPLQALAKHDAEIAKLLYVTLFDAALEKAREEDNFLSRAQIRIERIFRTTESYTPSLMGSLLEVARNHRAHMDFQLDTVKKVSEWSGLMSVGCVIIEEYLMKYDADVICSPSPKRGVAAVDTRTTGWLTLAKLYRSLEDWDSVRAIFISKITSDERTLQALEAESAGTFHVAETIYSTLISSETDLNRKDFYYESYFRCLCELGQWKSMLEAIDTTTGDEDTWAQLWSDAWNSERLLPYYMKAALRISLDDAESKRAFMTLLNKTMLDEKYQLTLKTNYSDKLAVLSVAQNELNNAKSHLNSYKVNFLKDWAFTSPLFTMVRGSKLLQMRNVMDIVVYTDDLEDINKYNIKKKIELLRSVWERCLEEKATSLPLAEERTVYRNQLVKHMKSTLTKFDLTTREKLEYTRLLDDLQSNIDASLIETSLGVKNCVLAAKYLQSKQDVLKHADRDNHQLYRYLFSKMAFCKGQVSSDDEQKIQCFERSLLEAKKCIEHFDSDPVLYLRACIHIINVIHEITSSNNWIPTDKIAGLFSQCDNSSWKAIEAHAVHLIRSELQEKSRYAMVRELLAEAYTLLAKRALGAENSEEELICYTLEAMKLESVEARVIFPHLLQLPSLHLSVRTNQFKETAADVPTWMFIDWISQLLAYIPTEVGPAVGDIVIRIAREYPNAIIYAYKISKEQLDRSVNEYCKTIYNTLDKLLRNDGVDDMLRALMSLRTPKSVITNLLKKLKRALQIQCHETFKFELDCVLVDLYDGNYNYNAKNSIRGPLFRHIDELKGRLLELGKITFNHSVIAKKLEDIETSAASIETSVADIGQYSPWLKNFNPNDYDQEIEIPGQYDGKKQPQPQHHVKLAGFKESIKILPSLRVPIKITMLGSDGKEYDFLVKCGEDLRQDQRIQQLFKLMNNILKNDPNCMQRKLQIVSYEVIPLTSKLGIIEWIESRVLMDFIGDSMNDREKKSLSLNRDRYLAWLKHVSSSPKTEIDLYVAGAKKYDRISVISKMAYFIRNVKTCALRDSFWKLSAGVDNYFALRQSFVRSYAAMSIAHWILGIGDRHFSNYLISLRDGQVVGIDFGHAFGTATQLLAVPELVPFRITPQILALLEPLREQGILQETMIHCLRAFQNNSYALLASMDVFLREPTISWEGKNAAPLDPHIVNQRILMCQRKLQGYNPTDIMIETLRSRTVDDPEVNRRYLELMAGDPQHNFRARNRNEKLNVEDQVKSLLDMATDHNLLGRMFAGWAPWL